MRHACRIDNSTSRRNTPDPGDAAPLCVCVPGRRQPFTCAEAFWRRILPAPVGASGGWRVVDGARDDLQELTETAEICLVSGDRIDSAALNILLRTKARNPAGGLIGVFYELHHTHRVMALEAGADLVLPMIEDGRLVAAAVSALRRRILAQS